MAVRTDEEIKALFSEHLEPGELLLHTAYGVKQPHLLLILGLCLLLLLPGLIAIHFLTKNYFIGLTGRRFIVLQVKGVVSSKITRVIAFNRNDLSSADIKTSENAIFTNIKLIMGEETFIAKFHRAFSKSNRPNASAIARELQATQNSSFT